METGQESSAPDRVLLGGYTEKEEAALVALPCYDSSEDRHRKTATESPRFDFADPRGMVFAGTRQEYRDHVNEMR